MKKDKIKEGCAYWARLPYDNPKMNESHIVVVVGIHKGPLWNTYTVVPLTTSTRNVDNVSEYHTVNFKGATSLLKHYEVQSLGSRKFIKFAFKPSEKELHEIRKRASQWILDTTKME